MIETREHLAPVVVPTPVLALACDAGKIWVGGVGGVACASPDDPVWQTRSTDLPLTNIAALASRDGLLLAGGCEGVAYSYDGGCTWQQSALQEGLTSVSALALSPRFAQDGTALVATLDSGILRSTDRARTWHSASFGLDCFEITALLWAIGETVLAATPEGLYRSTNAGRAWKSVADCAETPISALACSPDGTLLAASDDGTLLVSRDQGAHWEIFCTSPDYAQPTALWVTPEGTILLGTAARGLLRVANTRTHGEPVLDKVPLALAAQNQVLYAGTDAGIFSSTNDGKTWQILPYPPINDLYHVHALPGHLLLSGPHTGLVRSTPDGGWECLLTPVPPLMAVAATASGLLLASNESGLHRSEDGGEHWQTVLAGAHGQVTHMSFRADGSGWAVTADSSYVLRTRDSGLNWQTLPAPFGILPLSAIVADEALLIVATHDPRLNLTHIWRSHDDGETWIHGLEVTTSWPVVAVNQEPLAFTLGGTVVMRQQDGAWTQCIVGTAGEPGGFVRRLLTLKGHLLALTTTGIFCLEPHGSRWESLPLNEKVDALLDIVAVDDQLYGLLAGGRVVYLEGRGLRRSTMDEILQ